MKEGRLYSGANLKIKERVEKNEDVRALIESMVTQKPSDRVTITQIREWLYSIYDKEMKQ